MRYFFNLAGAVHDPDNKGLQCRTISDARIQAVTLAAEMLKDRPELAWLGEEFRVEVTNKDSLVLFNVIVLGVDAPAGAAMNLPREASAVVGQRKTRRRVRGAWERDQG